MGKSNAVCRAWRNTRMGRCLPTVIRQIVAAERLLAFSASAAAGNSRGSKPACFHEAEREPGWVARRPRRLQDTSAVLRRARLRRRPTGCPDRRRRRGAFHGRCGIFAARWCIRGRHTTVDRSPNERNPLRTRHIAASCLRSPWERGFSAGMTGQVSRWSVGRAAV